MRMKLSLIPILILISSCACVDERVDLDADKAVVYDIQQSGDLLLAKAFKAGNLPQEYQLSWKKDSIEVLSFVGLYIPQTLDTISLYQKSKQENDRVATIYRQAVQSRGNIIKTYNASANEAIVGCFQQHPQADIYRRFDLDNTLVEYDADGNMVSALVRIHRFNRNMVTDEHFVISKIYTGKLIDNIERDLKDFNFSANLVASN